MKELEYIKTKSYDAGNGFEVDIVIDEKDQYYHSYLYHVEYGHKLYMFGMPMKQQSYDEFLEIVEKNVDDYREDIEYLNVYGLD